MARGRDEGGSWKFVEWRTLSETGYLSLFATRERERGRRKQEGSPPPGRVSQFSSRPPSSRPPSTRDSHLRPRKKNKKYCAKISEGKTRGRPRCPGQFLENFRTFERYTRTRIFQEPTMWCPVPRSSPPGINCSRCCGGADLARAIRRTSRSRVRLGNFVTRFPTGDSQRLPRRDFRDLSDSFFFLPTKNVLRFRFTSFGRRIAMYLKS